MKILLFLSLLFPFILNAQSVKVKAGSAAFISIDNGDGTGYQNYERGYLGSQYNYSGGDSTLCIVWLYPYVSRFIQPKNKTLWLDGDNSNTAFPSMKALRAKMDTIFEATGTGYFMPIADSNAVPGYATIAYVAAHGLPNPDIYTFTNSFVMRGPESQTYISIDPSSQVYSFGNSDESMGFKADNANSTSSIGDVFGGGFGTTLTVDDGNAKIIANAAIYAPQYNAAASGSATAIMDLGLFITGNEDANKGIKIETNKDGAINHIVGFDNGGSTELIFDACSTNRTVHIRNSPGTMALTADVDSASFNVRTWANSLFLTSVPAQSFSSLTGKPSTAAGYGITDVPTIVSSADLAAVTVATVVATYAVTSTADYQINTSINISAVTTDVINIRVVWTDQNSTAQTYNGSSISTTGQNEFIKFFRAKTGTNIVISTILTTGIGSITYDVGSRIIKL